jgi:uncharacterized protein
MKSLIKIAMLTLAWSAAPVFAQTTAQLQLAPDKPLLTISVTEAVQGPPDVATVSVGVQALSPTASAAMSNNAARMDDVIKAIRARKVAAKDIQTTGISLSLDYDYSSQVPGKPPRFVGYRVTNTVRVTSRDLPNLGALLDTMATAGGTSIEGPNFAIENTEPLMRIAKDRAMVTANVRAKEYAIRAGFARYRLVTITEGQGYSQPYSALTSIVVTSNGGGGGPPPPPPPPVAPGQMSTGLTLTVQYVLEN